MTGSPIASAFTEAARRLGFSFESAFEILVKDGTTIRSLGLVRGFGSSFGTLLFSELQCPSEPELAELKRMGYCWSVLFEPYKQFDEEHFKATLNDWGFYGRQSERPAWYTGQAWSR